MYESIEAENNKLSFYENWISAYKKLNYHLVRSELGTPRTTQAITSIGDNLRYGDMKKDLQERFHLLRGSTPFHESGNNIDIKFCDNELTINYSRLTYAPSIDGLLIQHTSPSEFINSKKIMSILYDKLIQDENYYQNKDNFLKFIKTLAELSWHLSQAMLFSRGSASINELLITSILSYKKIHLPEYKEIGTCDLMAIFRYPRRVLSGVS